MARRARKGVETVHILIIAGVVGVFLLGAVIFVMAKRTSDPFASLNDFPLQTYLENGRSLTKQTFKLTGTITGNDQFTASRGHLIYVELDNGGDPFNVAVHVPPELESQDLGNGQTITAKVEVQRSGGLALMDLK